MADISILKKRLSAYSSIAAVMIAANYEKAGAQIIYHDIDPDEIAGETWSYLDLDNDSVFDFGFRFEHNSGYCPASEATAVALNNNYLLKLDSSYVAALDLSDSISQSPPDMFWANGPGKLFSYDCMTGYSEAHSCENCFAEGPWHSVKDKYLGIILHESDGNHYGWIRMTDGKILKDYAYQSQPEIPIAAGEFDNCDTVHAEVYSSYPPCICNSTVTLSANAGPYLIQWLKNGVTIANAVNPTNPTYSAGNYSVILYSIGCADTSLAFDLSDCPGRFAPTITRNADTLISSTGFGNQWYNYAYDPIGGATDSKFIFSENGSYHNNVTDSFGCISPLTGVYVLTCENSFHVDLTNIPLSDTLCNSGSILLNAYFISGTSYQWFRNEDSIPEAIFHSYSAYSSGDYFVTARENLTGCRDTSGTYHLLADTISVPSIQQVNDSLISSSAFSYQWYFNYQIISGATDQIYIPTQGGVYQVQVADSNGCAAISDTIFFYATEIIEASDDIFINMSLNHHQLTIQLDRSLVGSDLFLYDILGNLKEQLTATTNTAIFNVENFSSGIYFLQVKKDEKQWTKKIFIE